MSLVLVAAPSGEPISLEEAKDFLRVDTSADDVLIASLITAARQAIDGRDGWLGRALMTQQWDLYLDQFPNGCEWPQLAWLRAVSILIPLAPLQTVDSVKYLDSDGTLQTLGTSSYRVVSWEEPARIEPAYGVYWPATRRVSGAVTVRFTAGFGKATAVPDSIRLNLRQRVTVYYENRMPVPTPGLDDELASLRVYA